MTVRKMAVSLFNKIIRRPPAALPKPEIKMALVPVYGLEIPHSIRNLVGADPFLGTIRLDAASEKAAMICQVPKTGNVRKIHLLLGAVSGGTDTNVRLESVTFAGEPSGSLLATNTDATVVAASMVSSAYLTPTLTADAAVTRGQMVAVVIAPTGTPTYIDVSTVSADGSQVINPAYCTHYTGAWQKQVKDAPVMALEYDDGSFAYMPGVWAIKSLITVATLYTDDEYGIKFKFPAPVSIVGMWLNMVHTTIETLEVRLYDSDGTTVLETVVLDKDVSAQFESSHWKILFPASHVLDADTYYRVTVGFPPFDAVPVTLYGMTFDSVAVMASMAGGADFHRTYRNVTSWNDITTQRLFMGVILDGIELPDQGSGLQSPHFG